MVWLKVLCIITQLVDDVWGLMHNIPANVHVFKEKEEKKTEGSTLISAVKVTFTRYLM